VHEDIDVIGAVSAISLFRRNYDRLAGKKRSDVV